MKTTLRKWFPKIVLLVAVAAVLLANVKPARAMPCFTDLGQCYGRAAAIDSVWWRWAAGLDCELTFTACLREDLAGW